MNEISWKKGENERASTLRILDIAIRVPEEKHEAYLADLWAHSASYGAGFIGGLFLAIHTYRRRPVAAQAISEGH